MARVRWWLLAAPIIVTVLAACGWSSPSSPPSPDFWVADPFAAEAPWHTHYWWADVVEPSAENASLGLPEDRKQDHHILFFRADGYIVADRDCGRFLAVNEVGEGDIEPVLTSWFKSADEPCSTGWPHYVLLVADRQAPWHRVRDALTVLAAMDIPNPEVRIAVSMWPSARAHHIAMDLRSCLAHEGEDPNTLDVRIGEDREAGGVILEVGGRARTFPPTPDRFDDAGFLREANSDWKDVKRQIVESAGRAGRARIQISEQGGGPWFAYVISVLDLLLGAGVQEVELVEEGICLSLAPPTDATWPVDEPAVGWWMLTAALVAVALAFLLTFMPLWIGRGRRRRQTAR